MSQRKSLLFKIFSLLISVTLCIAILLVASILILLPRRAEVLFGPPAPYLDPSERYYLSALLLLQEDSLTTPYNPSGSSLRFPVELGETTGSIINRLVENKLVINPDAFRIFLRYSGLDTTIQAGEHVLSQSMTAVEISQTMQDAIPTHVTFNILPGWRLEEIAETLPTSGLNISADDAFNFANASIEEGSPGNFNIVPELKIYVDKETLIMTRVYLSIDAMENDAGMFVLIQYDLKNVRFN